MLTSKYLKLLDHLKSADPARGTTPRALRLGVPAIDAALGGGLAFGLLHELFPSSPLHFSAATAFVLALAALREGNKQVLWIQQDDVSGNGELYGPGLDLIGLPAKRVFLLRVPRIRDVLWAMEESLKCRASVTAIAEIADSFSIDLRVTRRLALAARESGGMGLLFHHKPTLVPSPAATRWEIASARGASDRFGGLGPAAFSLSLLKNRRGPCARWAIVWNHHERRFSTALPLGVAAAASDQSDPAQARHAS
jgi:protein ImuA